MNLRRGMADLWVVLTVIGFVLLSAAYIKGCDLIIGPDDAPELDVAPDEPARPVSADR